MKNNMIPTISNDGNLSFYMQQIKKFPLLEAKEEYMLAKAWKNQGDMVVFAIPLCVFKPTALFEEKGRTQYITLWFYAEDIDAIVNR